MPRPAIPPLALAPAAPPLHHPSTTRAPPMVEHAQSSTAAARASDSCAGLVFPLPCIETSECSSKVLSQTCLAVSYKMPQAFLPQACVSGLIESSFTQRKEKTFALFLYRAPRPARASLLPVNLWVPVRLVATLHPPASAPTLSSRVRPHRHNGQHSSRARIPAGLQG
jgi:hypothetical protein